MREKQVKEYVKKRCGGIAKDEESCCPSSCCVTSVQEIALRIGYSEKDLKEIPEASSMELGCGNPVALASLKKEEIVLDLGSGGGIDTFLAKGKVIGVDMTEEMVIKARATSVKHSPRSTTHQFP